MSDIHGEGHGSDHNWKHSHTSEGRQTLYKCVDCGFNFWHDYNRVVNIFEAMKGVGVPAKCDKKPIPVSNEKIGYDELLQARVKQLKYLDDCLERIVRHVQYKEPGPAPNGQAVMFAIAEMRRDLEYLIHVAEEEHAAF